MRARAAVPGVQLALRRSSGAIRARSSTSTPPSARTACDPQGQNVSGDGATGGKSGCVEIAIQLQVLVHLLPGEDDIASEGGSNGRTAIASEDGVQSYCRVGLFTSEPGSGQRTRASLVDDRQTVLLNHCPLLCSACSRVRTVWTVRTV